MLQDSPRMGELNCHLHFVPVKYTLTYLSDVSLKMRH